MSKIITVAINSLKGNDTISGHTGKSRKFWIFSLQDKRIINKVLLKLNIDQTIHHVFHDSGNYENPIFNVDFIITAGMGQGAINRFLERGILAIITSETSVDKAISLLLAEKLPVIVSEASQSCSHN